MCMAPAVSGEPPEVPHQHTLGFQQPMGEKILLSEPTDNTGNLCIILQPKIPKAKVLLATSM